MSEKSLKKNKRKKLNADAKLREVFTHWHHAAESYENTEQFRIYLNACIQALRNTTFVLQKQKRQIPNFDSWYTQWQDYLKSNLIMNWCVTARNTVVKKGDLETHSAARACYLRSYIDPPQNDFKVDPFTDTATIAKEIADKLPNDLKQAGYLKVERRWVANDLPDYELLEILAYAYSILSCLVKDVKAQQGPHALKMTSKKDIIINQGMFPACMSSFSNYRSVYLKFPSMEVERYSSKGIDLGTLSAEELIKKYGDDVLKNHGVNKDKSHIFNLAVQFKEQAKIMLSVDGYLVTTVMMISEDKILHLMPVEFRDNDHKYVMMREIAKEAERRRATSLILIGESWSAQTPVGKPIVRASECPDKTEAINVSVVAQDGEEFSFIVPFERKENYIFFGKEMFHEAPSSILLPIKKIWSKS
jgi:hypothetical protein